MPNKSQSSSSGATTTIAFERLSLTDSTTAATPAPAAASSVSDARPPSSLSKSEQQLIHSCIDSLITLIDKLQESGNEPLTSTTHIDAPRLIDYGDLLKHQLTRFVVMVSKGEVGILRDASDELSKHITGISNVMRTMLSTHNVTLEKHDSNAVASSTSSSPVAVVRHVGRTQRRAITSTHSAVLRSVRNVIVQMREHLLHRSSVALDVRLTGAAWSTIESQLKQCPTNNTAAIGKEMATLCSGVADAKKELEQIKVEEEEKENVEDDAADDDDDDDFMDMDDDDGLSPAEFAIVPACLLLTNTASMLVKNAYMYVLKAKVDESLESNVTWLESVLQSSSALRATLDDLISSLYSPQDRSVAHKAARKLAGGMRDLALAIVTQHAQSNAEWPVKAQSSSSDTSNDEAAMAESFAACDACSTTMQTAVALQQPADAEHKARLDWLHKCLTQIHEGHKQVDDLPPLAE